MMQKNQEWFFSHTISDWIRLPQPLVLFFSDTISDWIRLPQPLVLFRSVETVKAAVRILYEILMYEICKNVLTIFNPYVQTLT